MFANSPTPFRGLELYEPTLYQYQSINDEDELRHFDFDTSVLITFEGPIDFIEYGDSLSGHYDALTTAKQSQSHKNYLKVINMLGLSAISIPTSQLSTSILMICKSDPTYIRAMMAFAQQIPFERSALESRYFTPQE